MMKRLAHTALLAVAALLLPLSAQAHPTGFTSGLFAAMSWLEVCLVLGAAAVAETLLLYRWSTVPQPPENPRRR